MGIQKTLVKSSKSFIEIKLKVRSLNGSKEKMVLKTQPMRKKAINETMI